MQSCCLRCDCFKLCEGKIVFACDEKHLFKEFSASFESMNSDVWKRLRRKKKKTPQEHTLTETETNLQPVHRGRIYTCTGFQPGECALRIRYLMLPSDNEHTHVSRDSCGWIDEVGITHCLGCLPVSFCVIILYLALSFLARLDSWFEMQQLGS